jgi:hypothetical protein
MVFLSSESGDKPNFFYFVHPDWHKIGAEFTKQIISFLEYSTLTQKSKANLISVLNKTLNVLGCAMYHLRNYGVLEQSRCDYLRNAAPPAKDSGRERFVLIPDLQCELQSFLLQLQRSLDTLPEMMKPVLTISKEIIFGESGEGILDVLQEILISDIADVKKHPIEKLIRLMEHSTEPAQTGRSKKRPWIKLLSDFRRSAMKEEEPALAVYHIEGNSGEQVEVHTPRYSKHQSLLEFLESLWKTTLEFHRDFYSLMVFWTLRSTHTFTLLSIEEQSAGRKWAIVETV